MLIQLKGGRVIDPAHNRDGVGDLYIENGRIVEKPEGREPGLPPRLRERRACSMARLNVGQSRCMWASLQVQQLSRLPDLSTPPPDLGNCPPDGLGFGLELRPPCGKRPRPPPRPPKLPRPGRRPRGDPYRCWTIAAISFVSSSSSSFSKEMLRILESFWMVAVLPDFRSRCRSASLLAVE